MLTPLFLLFLSLTLISSDFVPPKPTESVLEWSRREIGVMYSYGMISFMKSITLNTQYFCIGVGGGATTLPPPSLFNPVNMNMDNWLQAAVNVGAKYAILVAQHCGGFSSWPTDIYKETGFNYTYSIRYSPYKDGQYDMVKDFINSCKKHGILPGIYYSLNQNFYLNVGNGGHILNTSLVPGQVKVSQELYGRIVLAQMRELWTNYGELSEIWFDGGCGVPGISDDIRKLLSSLQSTAVYFGGCSDSNNIRWIGTESGTPSYPVWTNSDGCSPGHGKANGNVFCPAESDTTLQLFDSWFWRPLLPIRTLDVLQNIYYKTVGQNTNLLLNVAPNDQGLVEDRSMERYSEFGSWIKACFGRAVISSSGKGDIVRLISAAGQPFRFDKLVIQEDQSNGASVTDFSIYNPIYNGTTPIFSGQSIGNKLIVTFENTLFAHYLVLNITQSFIEPVITHFGAYKC
jgi:alpha-L-fucosidase